MKAQQMKIMTVQKAIMNALIFACAVTALIYISLLGGTMFYATEANSFNRQIAEITGSLSKLEFEYINLKQSVTLGKAKELGFHEVQTTIFVRADEVNSVSMNTRAR